MLKWYRGKDKDYTSEEIDNSGEQLSKGQIKAELRVPNLHHYSWKYVQSKTSEELEDNRTTLIALLRPQDRHYINIYWRKNEEAVIYYYTKIFPNLRSTAS